MMSLPPLHTYLAHNDSLTECMEMNAGSEASLLNTLVYQVVQHPQGQAQHARVLNLPRILASSRRVCLLVCVYTVCFKRLWRERHAQPSFY